MAEQTPDFRAADEASLAHGLGREDLRSTGAWHVLRFAVAVLFIASALLKTHALATAPAAHGDFFERRPAQLLAVELELFLAAWLISGVAARAARFATMAMILLFAAVSALRLSQGFDSCGCFGRVTVHPGASLALDLAILWSLGYVRTGGRPQPGLHFVLILTYLLSASVAAFIVLSYKPRTIDEEGIVSVGHGLVLLEPEKWTGKRLPILPFLDGDVSQLDSGEWTILFYHHDCPKCQEVIPHYQIRDLARGQRRVAFVELPPYGDVELDMSGNVTFRLTDDYEWFMTTPVELLLEESIVSNNKSYQ